MKTVKTILILAVIALFMAVPAAAAGKNGDHKQESYKYKHHEYKHHKDKGPKVSQALLLFPAGSNMDNALTKHYRKDPLYQETDIHPYHQRGYVVGAGLFDLVIYNRGTHYGDETAYGVKLVVAINDLSLFDSAVINGVPLSKASFTQEPDTPRFDVSDEAFPDHGVFPAYYTEIEIGTIEKGTPIVVGVDVKGDPRDLLIHFDAYGQGTRYRCDDDCHGHKGKKGRGKKYDCDDKGKHRGKDNHDKDCCEDWEACTQAYDIRNKLSHDVTQVGGTSEIIIGNTLVIDEVSPPPFFFDAGTTEQPFTVSASIWDINNQPVPIVSSDKIPDSGVVFVLLGQNKRSFNLVQGEVSWPPNQFGTDFYLQLKAIGLLGLTPPGIYSLDFCIKGTSGNTTCSKTWFNVVEQDAL
jgi:hypothetical protein